MTSSTSTPTHLVDKLDQRSLLDLALDQAGAAGTRRAYAMPSRAELAPLFPDLEIMELLGSGGMGCVYKAKQTRLDRVIALKILPKELAKDDLFAERFAREARAMARLNHPNVVRVYDFGNAGDICFLIMEYMDGMNLRELLDAGNLAPDEAMCIFQQVSAALEYAHVEGVIHRDIKPENILFSRAGHVSLADFGLARLAMDSGCEVSLTQTRQAMGTLNYMAPEQWDNPKTVDRRADIYAMGILLYELLTGRVPRGSFPPASSLAGSPAEIDEVIHRALQVDPDKRFRSVREMTDALTVAAAGTPVDRRHHQGTFTRMINLGGLLGKSTPQPARLMESGSRAAYSESAFAVSLFVCIGVAACSFIPWCRNGYRYVPGIATSTVIEQIEIPNALIFVATLIVALLMRFRQAVHPLRANLISLVLTGGAIAIAACLIAGFPISEVTSSGFSGIEASRLTIVPFLIVALLGFQAIEIVIRLVRLLFRTILDFVFVPVRDRLLVKDEVRKQWWRDRWMDARNVFHPSGDDVKK